MFFLNTHEALLLKLISPAQTISERQKQYICIPLPFWSFQCRCHHRQLPWLVAWTVGAEVSDVREYKTKGARFQRLCRVSILKSDQNTAYFSKLVEMLLFEIMLRLGSTWTLGDKVCTDHMFIALPWAWHQWMANACLLLLYMIIDVASPTDWLWATPRLPPVKNMFDRYGTQMLWSALLEM